ncbi:terpene synthase family protein [Streptomyces sp. NPDC051921]|uniref:terpene synthase family protein n=1 Tax=Streptomyces sp. NPDC051921 TaxID=3155806 RepID=UPI00342DDEC8
MTVHAVELPKLWMPHPLRVNPHLSGLRAESESWAREMGMVNDDEGRASPHAIWTRSQYRAMAVDQLTAWTLPDAAPADLRLNHRFNIWALAWDDYFASAFKRTGDLPGALEFTARLHAFLRPESGARLPEPVNAVERGIADLQQQLFPPRLGHWRQEFNRALARYVDAGVEELANSRAGRVPHLIDYAPFRRESFAAHTAPYSVELATGARIPERLRGSRTVRGLLAAFMDVMGLANDIASYEREVHEEHDVNNLVVVIATSLGIPLREAVPAAVRLVNTRLRDFEQLRRDGVRRLARRSRSEPEERAELETWIGGACSFLSGLYAWYTGAPRYVAADAPPDPRHRGGTDTRVPAPPSVVGLGVDAQP